MRDEKGGRNNEKELENTGSSWLGDMLMGTSLTPLMAFVKVDTQNLLTFVNDTMDDGSQIYYFEEVLL